MLPFYRLVEVAVYSLLNFLPFMLLALYPFRNTLRFSRTKTYFLIGIILLIQIGLGITAAFSEAADGLLSALSTIIYAMFFFLAIKSHFGQILFILLMLSNVANFVVMASKCLEGLIFGDIAYEAYRFTFSLMMAIVELIFLIPLFLYMRNTYTIIFEKKSARDTWRFLWLIPATFYFVWYFNLYSNEASGLEIALQPNKTLLLFIINLGAIFIYHIVVQHINVIDSNASLAEQNYQLAMQNLQYENLQERIAEARHAKHDIRHHVTIMDDLLKNQEYDRLHEYLQSYKKSLPDDGSIVFCSHYAVNTLLLYFAQLAKDHYIDFNVSVSFPDKINIPDNVLSVILGNLLENAIEACTTSQKDSQYISVKGKYEPDSGSLFFKIDNTYSGNYIKNKKGLYMSTKHSGRGVGLASVRNITSQYNGMLEITPTEDMFSVSVLLMVP